MEPLIVVGGSVGGLATALALGRAGHSVTVVERDVIPEADDPEAAFAGERSGAPQAHQTHGLLARLMVELRDHFPDVLDDLEAAGAYGLPMTAAFGDRQPGDDDLYVLIARRTTLEWALRRAALAEPKVSHRSGVAVAGLVAGPRLDGVTRIVGARLTTGEVLDGTVVAATGRRGDVPGWLASAGVEVTEVVHPTELMYLTRWYRLPDGFDTTIEVGERIAGDLGYLKYMAIPGDGQTLSATLAIGVKDEELRAVLLQPEHFDAACGVLPGAGRFFVSGDLEPIGPVRPMGGLINRLRSFVGADGVPLVAGFHALGDAHTCTNPLYGRGCSLAFVQARLLAAAFAAHPDDALARSADYEAASAAEVEPWFHYAVMTDQMGRGSTRRAALPTVAVDAAADPAAAFGVVMAAAATDPVIGRAISRVFNLLALPDTIFSNPEFLTRVAAVLADPASVPPVDNSGPTRRELLALIGVAA